MCFRSLLLAIVCVAALIGCAKEPVEQIEAAKQAIAGAQNAEANTYAPQMFKMASDTLRAAMAAKQQADAKKFFRSYKETERLLAKAQEIANQAAAAAQQQKEIVKAEVSQLFETAKAVLDSTDMAIKKAPRGKGSKVEIEMMKSELASTQTMVTEAQTAYEQGKYAMAKAKLENAIQKAHSIMDEIASATAKIKK
ncbi:MAG: hypothetical protein ACUVQ7_05225 [bacterium]